MSNAAHATTESANRQAQRIDLIVAHEASEHRVLPIISGWGKLVEFRVDGQVTEPPVPDMPQLYRWLQVNGYVPRAFKWLGWKRGLRHRRVTCIRTR